ncbi:hypothetical protein EDB83DRAFT_2317340 [Lactarius deliciosus]|nr:hypothetical protein EDB83DRAFT_2317340 [Lactarius deliciosus]
MNPIFVAWDISANTMCWPGLKKYLGTSRLTDLKIRSAKDERRRSLPPRHEYMTAASEPRLSSPTYSAACTTPHPLFRNRHLPGAARRRSGVATLHSHAARGRRRDRHRLDAHDPAGPGGRQAEAEGKWFGFGPGAVRECPRMAEAPPITPMTRWWKLEVGFGARGFVINVLKCSSPQTEQE